MVKRLGSFELEKVVDKLLDSRSMSSSADKYAEEGLAEIRRILGAVNVSLDDRTWGKISLSLAYYLKTGFREVFMHAKDRVLPRIKGSILHRFLEVPLEDIVKNHYHSEEVGRFTGFLKFVDVARWIIGDFMLSVGEHRLPDVDFNVRVLLLKKDLQELIERFKINETALRECLYCGSREKFWSLHKGDRKCPKCKGDRRRRKEEDDTDDYPVLV